MIYSLALLTSGITLCLTGLPVCGIVTIFAAVCLIASNLIVDEPEDEDDEDEEFGDVVGRKPVAVDVLEALRRRNAEVYGSN